MFLKKVYVPFWKFFVDSDHNPEYRFLSGSNVVLGIRIRGVWIRIWI